MKTLGKVAYAVLFVIVLPALLALWAAKLDRLLDLPRVGIPWQGVALISAALVLMTAAIFELRRRGGGWPMSPYPPVARVITGPYALVENPIYAGATLLAAGLSIALRSAAGIWIVTPILAAACAAFVIGYEREATVRRFGPPSSQPLLRLPAASAEHADLADRLSIYVLVLFPWFVLFETINLLGAPRDVRSGYMRWDALIPVMPWSELLYILAYPTVLALPLLLQTKQQLRELALRGWFATVGLSMVYLFHSVSVIPKPVPADAPLATLLIWERTFEAPLTAFPAFHVVWAIIAAASYQRVYPRLWALWWSLAAAISVSCVTTGMHALFDIVAGIVAGTIVLFGRQIWRALLRWSETIANSWWEWDFGMVRLMNHGWFAAAGAVSGIVIAATLAGEEALSAVCVIGIAIIAGAALWAQFLEGSAALLRPYGYYGGLLGGCVAIAAMSLFGQDAWLLLAAYGVAAPVVQAFGRIRCLVQGCCHGRPAPEDAGIHYRHPRSRVVRLAQLRDLPLYPTPLYSIVWNVFIALALLRLWIVGAPLSFIAGVYFILNGLGRFVEEHYRGEPQTRIVGGLRIYQWLAIGSVLVGAIFTVAGDRAAPAFAVPSWRTWTAAALFGIVTYGAYGVDFPRWNVRFARLV